MITKLLDGLEMFLDVCGTSSNSNNLLALQVELAVWSRYPFSCEGTG